MGVRTKCTVFDLFNAGVSITLRPKRFVLNERYHELQYHIITSHLAKAITLLRKDISEQALGHEVCIEALQVILGVADIGADLGGSSKYSIANF